MSQDPFCKVFHVYFSYLVASRIEQLGTTPITCSITYANYTKTMVAEHCSIMSKRGPTDPLKLSRFHFDQVDQGACGWSNIKFICVDLLQTFYMLIAVEL